MIRKQITITLEGPMTRSYVAELVQLASGFESRIMLSRDNRVVNVKSSLGLLSLTAEARQGLTLVIEGADEEQAAVAMLAAKDIQAV